MRKFNLNVTRKYEHKNVSNYLKLNQIVRKSFVDSNFYQNKEIYKKNYEMLEFQKSLTETKFKEINKEIEKRIENKSYKLKHILDPNHFGDALIYLSPCINNLHNWNLKLEKTSIPFLMSLSFLSYLGIFGSGFFHYFIYCLLINAYIRRRFENKVLIVSQITLLNESEVKFVFLNGESKIVKIKDVKKNEIFPFENLNNPIKKDILLLVEDLRVNLNIFSINRYSLLEKEVLFAIINKNVESLTLE
jgi:hypothetical protein